MAFDDVRVPTTSLVGEEGDGMAFAHEWFRYERLMIGARCCGAAERLIDEATAFAKDRQAFGHPIPTTRRSSSCWPTRSPSCGRPGS